MQTMNKRFSPFQKRIVLGVVFAYILAYFDRLNLSAALPKVIDTLRVSPAQAGLMQTCFAVSYACGQLLNGLLADRTRPTRMILTGLAGSALCNIALGLCGSFTAMPAICLINGLFQSMLWTPIVKLISISFSEKQKQVKAHFWLSMTLVIGHFGAWVLSGLAGAYLNWRYSFILPALLNVLLVPLTAVLLRSSDTGCVRKSRPERDGHQKKQPVLPFFARTGFLFILFGCVFYGFIKDGIVTWTPELLNAAGGSGISSTLFSLIVPVINLFGILLGFALRVSAGGNARKTISLMLPAAALFCVPLFFVRSLPVSALFLGLSCAVCYGVNPLLTSLVPMEYDRAGCIGLAAGLTDCFVYVGSALSGAIGGSVYGQQGGNGLYICWALAALLASLMCFSASLRRFDPARFCPEIDE